MSNRRRLQTTTALQSPSPLPLSESLPPLQNLSESPLPPEIAENASQSEHSLSPDEGAHLDGITVDGGEPVADIPQPSDVGAGDTVVPASQWIEGFLGGFNLAGNFVKSLAIMPEEEGKARAAAEAIYNTALDVPSLRFLIAPQGKWIGRAAAVALFVGPKAVAARDELRARRAKAHGMVAANDNEPIAGERDEERTQF